MKLPRYPKYKDSGVKWLGKFPEHWEVKPLKYIASLKGRLGWQGLRSDEYTDDGPFLVTSEHFSNDKIEWHRCYHVSPDRYDLAPEIQLKSGDLLMMKDGAAMGKLAFLDELPGPACLNSHLLLFRPQNGRFENRFLYYVLGGPGFNSYMVQRRTGTTFFGISQESIGSFSFAIPPISEQNSILAFLRDEASKIDALVEEQRRLIELLKEKRQAAISRAVTKGLNSDTPMKDSGVEWLGEVPEHWEVLQLKWAVRFQRGHDLPSEEREEGDIPVVSSAGIIGKHSVSAAKGPGIVTGRYGSIGRFYLIKEDYWPLNTTLYSTSLRGNDPRFLVKMLENLSPLFLLNAVKSAVPGVDTWSVSRTRAIDGGQRFHLVATYCDQSRGRTSGKAEWTNRVETRGCRHSGQSSKTD
jgi:restriction endonuclease S subunit